MNKNGSVYLMIDKVNTLNGSLEILGETLAQNLTIQGVASTPDEGLTTLTNKVLDISGKGMSQMFKFSILDNATLQTFTDTPIIFDEGVCIVIYGDGDFEDASGGFTHTYTGTGEKAINGAIATTAYFRFEENCFGTSEDGNSGLVSITIPSNCRGLGDYCFSNSTNLTTITIDNSELLFGFIGGYCFSNCTNLQTITLNCPPPGFESTCFDGVTQNITFKVPQEYVEDYGSELYFIENKTIIGY